MVVQRETPIRILMVGPSIEGMGGIAEVQRIILSHLPHYCLITHLPTHGNSKLQSLYLFILSFLKGAWLILRTDVVHLHFASNGSTLRKWFFCLWPRLFNKPYILHLHGSLFESFVSKRSSFIQSRIRSWLHSSSKIIVLSEHAYNYLSNQFAIPSQQLETFTNPVEVQLQGVGLDTLSLGNILFLGRLEEEKGIYDIIHALALLPPHLHKHWHLHLAGSGEVDRLIELIQQLGIETQITLHGWISGEQKKALLKQSSLLLLPSYHESLPMALLEGMSYGLVPVATAVGGMKDLLVHQVNSWIVEAHNPKSIAIALTELAEQPALWEKLSKQSLASVQGYNVIAYMNRLGELYKRTLESGDYQ